VQSHDSTANAQLVYKGLLTAYEETLTTSLAATDLRSELTLLRFDDTWKKGSEAFLLHWRAKVLELEQLEDKALDDDTKRLWLTATLSTKSHMTNCIIQAKVTEMTILGMGTNTSTSLQMPWEHFYNLVLAQAKLYDHTTPNKSKTRETNVTERSGRGRGDGRGRGCGRYTAGRGYPPPTGAPRKDFVLTTFTGPNMLMKAKYEIFQGRLLEINQ
jgi:hypothetical protein